MRRLIDMGSVEIVAVSGGSAPAISPVKPKEVLPQDMYGNTMSVEAWMDYQANVLPDDPAPHDGYDRSHFPAGRGR